MNEDWSMSLNLSSFWKKIELEYELIINSIEAVEIEMRLRRVIRWCPSISSFIMAAMPRVLIPLLKMESVVRHVITQFLVTKICAINVTVMATIALLNNCLLKV